MSGRVHPWRDQDYLAHIATAIVKIQRYTAQTTEAAFSQDEQLQDAVIRNLEIVGEAVTKLSDDFKAQHPAVPWRDIANMRHRLIHAYMTVNLEIVWFTVQKALPDLLDQIRNIDRS